MINPDAQPMSLAELDVNPSAFPFGPETPLTRLDGGFNSNAFRVGERAIKISKTCGSPERMTALLKVMRGEHDLMADSIGDNMPETKHELVPAWKNPTKRRIVIFQEFVPGLTLPDYMAEQDAETSQLGSFLEECLNIFNNRRVIPDLANIQQRFEVFRNTNVVMRVTEDGSPRPMLTDTNFGRIQRSKLGGPLLTRGIVWGVKQGLKQIG